MKAICRNGVVVDCGGFKATDTGVVLTADEDRDEVIGFLPNERLAYLFPDEVLEHERDRLGLEDGEPAELAALRTELEGRLDELERRVERLADAGRSDGGTGGSPSLSAVRGLGPLYRDRLHDAGIHTVADLAGCEPTAVPDAADVVRSRARRWVRRARST